MKTIMMILAFAMALVVMLMFTEAVIKSGQRTKRGRVRFSERAGSFAAYFVAGLRDITASVSRYLWRPRPAYYLANIAEGVHQSGNITYEVDAAVTERFLLAKRGGAANRVDICGAANVPIGVITDEAAAAGDIVNVALLGAIDRTVRMVASAAITQDDLLEPAANGRVATLGGGAGTHHVVGRALQAAANAGDVIEVDPFYFLRVI